MTFQLLNRELSEVGYSGVSIRKSTMKTEIIIRAPRPQEIIGENSRRINELTALIQKRFVFYRKASSFPRFGFNENNVVLYAERVAERSLCAQTQAEALKYRLLAGLPVRRAAYAVIRSALEAGAKGCEVIVSGKLRQQRANAMKFKEGYMIKTGNACREFVDEAVRHVQVKQGMLGVKVRIMKPTDPEGRLGPKKALPDIIVVHEPKEYHRGARAQGTAAARLEAQSAQGGRSCRGGEGAVKDDGRSDGLTPDCFQGR